MIYPDGSSRLTVTLQTGCRALCTLAFGLELFFCPALSPSVFQPKVSPQAKALILRLFTFITTYNL